MFVGRGNQKEQTKKVARLKETKVDNNKQENKKQDSSEHHKGK